MGPLISAAQRERVLAYIEQGKADGNSLVYGGNIPPGLDRGFFVEPTIFDCPSNSTAIAQEEIFGPVVCVIGFDTEEEAIAIANDTPYGLAAYVQTGDPERARRVARQLRAGAVHINGGAYEYGSPFGGYKQSGNGRELGPHGLTEFVELKSMQT